MPTDLEGDNCSSRLRRLDAVTVDIHTVRSLAVFSSTSATIKLLKQSACLITPSNVLDVQPAFSKLSFGIDDSVSVLDFSSSIRGSLDSDSDDDVACTSISQLVWRIYRSAWVYAGRCWTNSGLHYGIKSARSTHRVSVQSQSNEFQATSIDCHWTWPTLSLGLFEAGGLTRLLYELLNF